MKPKILIITGPTAVGKSKIAVDLAHAINGEIIGVDSVQVYKGLNIGSGKVTEVEKSEIAHHMIDVLEPQCNYSVSEYVIDAQKCVDEVLAKGRVPILVGGTALYINGILQGHNFADAPKCEKIREKYKQILDNSSNEYLHSLLHKVDPISAVKIPANDVRRVIRALEIYEITGQAKSAMVKAEPDGRYDYRMTVLTKERALLYKQIELRVDKMFESGLIDEVEGLLKYKNCQSMQAIGYKEVVQYLQGNVSMSDAIESVKKNSRHYAKRQLTFFRGISSSKKWIDLTFSRSMPDILCEIRNFFEA